MQTETYTRLPENNELGERILGIGEEPSYLVTMAHCFPLSIGEKIKQAVKTSRWHILYIRFESENYYKSFTLDDVKRKGRSVSASQFQKLLDGAEARQITFFSESGPRCGIDIGKSTIGYYLAVPATEVKPDLEECRDSLAISAASLNEFVCSGDDYLPGISEEKALVIARDVFSPAAVKDIFESESALQAQAKVEFLARQVASQTMVDYEED